MEGETILCVSPRVWRSLWRDTQPIMWRLAQHNRVLFFEPGRNPDRPSWAEIWRNLPYILRLRIEPILENLILISSPPQLPLARQCLPPAILRITTPLTIGANAWLLTRHIRRTMRALGITHPILWLYGPFHHSLVGKFGEKLSCYFNYDEFADFFHNQRISDQIKLYERQLVERVDVVFATSRVQWARRKAFNQNTYFVPNGVDFDLFNRALSPASSTPLDIVPCPRPIIGFAGWLGYQVDVPLLLRVADAYPTSSVVLVGPDDLPDTSERRQLGRRPNVFFLGCKDRGELPDYLREFDVALIPYVLHGHAASAYPLKLHEYLAAGRDTVATALPELQPFGDVVRVASSSDEFINLVGQALDGIPKTSVEARVAVARENTWDHRVAEIYSILDPLLDGKGNGR